MLRIRIRHGKCQPLGTQEPFSDLLWYKATMKTKKFSIAEAARELGMTRAGMHAAIRQKRLRAKVGTFEVERTVKTKVKGWLIDERDLTAAMTLLDKNENPQIAVSESKDGSLFALNDNKGNTRIILGNLSQGPTLRLYDERGQIMGKVP
jgi:hypothetical protein